MHSLHSLYWLCGRLSKWGVFVVGVIFYRVGLVLSVPTAAPSNKGGRQRVALLLSCLQCHSSLFVRGDQQTHNILNLFFRKLILWQEKYIDLRRPQVCSYDHLSGLDVGKTVKWLRPLPRRRVIFASQNKTFFLNFFQPYQNNLIIGLLMRLTVFVFWIGLNYLIHIAIFRV